MSRFAALAVLMVLAGCGGETTVIESAGPDSDGVSATSKPESKPSIRSFDLANAKWKDVAWDKDVQLRDGKATVKDSESPVGEIQYATAGHATAGGEKVPATLYLDADGDGDEDAFTGLQSAPGGVAVPTVWHFWLWDAAKKTATQLVDPIAQDVHGGDTVESVRVAKSGKAVVIKERQRWAGDTAGPGDEPEHDAVRRVAVRGGMPTMLGKHPFYGGVCDRQALSPGEAGGMPIAVSSGPTDQAPSSNIGYDENASGSLIWAEPTHPMSWRKAEGWIELRVFPYSEPGADHLLECAFVKVQDLKAAQEEAVRRGMP